MTIQNVIIGEIAYKTWCIDEYGMDAMFLLEGEEKSLLIDTGTGVCDLPSVVKSLTNKPLMVVLTHGHVDHAGGIGMFEHVYIHPDDMERASAVTVEERREYTDILMSMSQGIYGISKDSVVLPKKKTTMKPLTEGVIHLGGRDVKVIETPGHTPGGMSFIDLKERICFSGDACNVNTLMALGSEKECRPKSQISVLLHTAEMLKENQPLFDRHYNGHIGYADMVGIQSQDEHVIDECIALCKGLLDGSLHGEKNTGGFGGNCMVIKGKYMQIQYLPEQVC